MIFESTLPIPPEALVRMVGWVARGYPRTHAGKLLRFIRSIRFHKSRSLFQGWYHPAGVRKITVGIGPSGGRYPVTQLGSRDFDGWLLLDAIDTLVHVTTHEMAHAEFDLRTGYPGTERAVEVAARPITTLFRESRRELCEDWGIPDVPDLFMCSGDKRAPSVRVKIKVGPGGVWECE